MKNGCSLNRGAAVIFSAKGIIQNRYQKPRG